MKKLHNGYYINKSEIYNGFTMETIYYIYTPSDKLYCSCSSYKKAIAIASNL